MVSLAAVVAVAAGWSRTRWWGIRRVRSRRRVWRVRCRWRTRRGWWRCAARRCWRWRAGAGWCRSPLPPKTRRRCVEGLSVAAVNGPASTVVSGDVGAVEALLDELVAEGVRARRIPVDYASHSAQVEAIRGELRTCWRRFSRGSAEVPFYSTVTGGLDRHRRAGRRVLVPEPAADGAVRGRRARPAGRGARRVRRVQSASGADRRCRGDRRRGRGGRGGGGVAAPRRGRAGPVR